MPYVNTVGDIVRVTAVALYPNDQIEEMTFHLACMIGSTSDSRLAIAGWMDSLIQARMMSYMSNQATYYGSVVHLRRAAYKYNPVHTLVNTPGTSPDHTLPTQCRPLVAWGTDFAGGHGRGRTFLFTPTVLQVAADGVVEATYITAMLAWASTVMAGYTDGATTWAHVLATETKPPVVELSATAIISRKMSSFFATQRRSGALGKINAVPW